MRIGFDARWIFKEISGIGAYATALLRELARIDTTHEYVVFFQREVLRDRTLRETGLADNPRITTQILHYGPFAPRSQIDLPRRMRQLGLAVFHSPNFMLPMGTFSRPAAPAGITTIHDLIPLLFPQYTPRSLKTRFFPLYRALMRSIAARAHQIVTVSENSRRDIITALGVSPERITVTYNGVGPEFHPAPHRTRSHYEALYVGRMDPYKNLTGVIRVLQEARRISGADIRLKIVGPPDDRYPEAARLALALGLDPFIRWTGYTTGPELIDAYQQADVLLLLSRYEGFGFPVVESMACGTPVICSNTSALPEVAGDAAVLVDPDDTHTAAHALIRILSDTDWARERIERGLRRAAQFSWENTARQTLAAYRACVADTTDSIP